MSRPQSSVAPAGRPASTTGGAGAAIGVIYPGKGGRVKQGRAGRHLAGVSYARAAVGQRHVGRQPRRPTRTRPAALRLLEEPRVDGAAVERFEESLQGGGFVLAQVQHALDLL